MSDRARRAELEALQSAIARLERESLAGAIAQAKDALEREEQRLARLRAELTQLAPRVEHLRARLQSRRAREREREEEREVVQPVPTPDLRAPREALSKERKVEQVQASVVYLAAVVFVILFFMCTCMVFTGKH